MTTLSYKWQTAGSEHALQLVQVPGTNGNPFPFGREPNQRPGNTLPSLAGSLIDLMPARSWRQLTMMMRTCVFNCPPSRSGNTLRAVDQLGKTGSSTVGVTTLTRLHGTAHAGLAPTIWLRGCLGGVLPGIGSVAFAPERVGRAPMTSR